MTSDFDELWQQVREMGAKPIRAEDFVVELPPIVVPKGDSNGEVTSVSIELDNLDQWQNHGGLLSFEGKQVLVYIPDQGARLRDVLRQPSLGRKFHVSHCRTLDWMAKENRNDRYIATNDTSGVFELTGSYQSEPQKGRLHICKNCLEHLNYKGYADSESDRNHIFNQFDLTEFFATFSSLFRYPYARRYRSGGNFDSTQSLNTTFREPVALTSNCSQCDVSLSGNVAVSGLPQGSENRQSTILCQDCDRRANWQDADPVVADQMRRINRERRKQGLMDNIEDWSEAFDLADPALHGLMRLYRRHEWPIPDVGIPLTDSQGVVLEGELDLVWEDKRYAVVVSPEDKAVALAQGWEVKTLGEAMLDARQDG